MQSSFFPWETILMALRMIAREAMKKGKTTEVSCRGKYVWVLIVCISNIKNLVLAMNDAQTFCLIIHSNISLFRCRAKAIQQIPVCVYIYMVPFYMTRVRYPVSITQGGHLLVINRVKTPINGYL